MVLDSKTLDMTYKYLGIYNSRIENLETINSKDLEIQKLLAASILNNLILSKQIFKRNNIIGEFMLSYFNFKISKYALSSRALICGKITKHISEMKDQDDIIDWLNTLYVVLSKIEKGEDFLQKDMYDVIGGIKL